MPDRSRNLTRLDRMGYVALGTALLGWGLPRRGAAGAGTTLLGGWLLYQAYTARNPLFRPLGIRVNAQPQEQAARETIVVDESVAIGRRREDLYRFWRALDELPRIAPRLREVAILDERRSRWRVDGPRGAPLEWLSEITADEPDREIAWRTTTHDGALAHFGSIRFEESRFARGTIVRVHLEYVPPAGALGTALARAAGQSPQRLVRDALRRLKQLLETGEIATTAGQPAGAGRSPLVAHLEHRQAGEA